MARRVDEVGVAVWRERIGRFEAAGGPVAAFCAGEGVSVPSFYQWRRRLRDAAGDGAGDNGSPKNDKANGFAMVRVTRGRANSMSATAPRLVAILPGGTRIELPLDCERSLSIALRALLSADRGVASC